jgi:hypothetical protein
MSESDANGRVKVTDEEHSVDKQLKNSVLKLRQTIDEDERKLYVDRLRDPEIPYSRMEANQDWGVSVRQYLRAIKRLWDEDENMAGVTEYWRRKELGSVTLVPPDTNNYQFSAVTQEASRPQLRRFIGLPRGVDIPEPFEYTFSGLGDILNTRIVQHSWTVTVDNSGPPPSHERVTVQDAQVVSKPILENAVEAADAFLQQGGLGFEVSLPDYYGGEEAGI